MYITFPKVTRFCNSIHG